MKKLSMYFVIVSIITVFLAVISTPILRDQGANAEEPKRIASASPAQTGWRADYQKAYNYIREHRNDKEGKLLVKMETELKASEKTMTTAEQLLSKKPINKQAANSIVANIDKHTSNLNNLTSGLTIPTTTDTAIPTTTTMTQTQMATMLSNISKQMYDMRMAIIRNLR